MALADDAWRVFEQNIGSRRGRLAALREVRSIAASYITAEMNRHYPQGANGRSVGVLFSDIIVHDIDAMIAQEEGRG